MALPIQPPADYGDDFMLAALAEAKAALGTGEVPVGCVFVCPTSRRIIARGHNMTNARKNALEHAELVAIAGAMTAAHDEADAAISTTRGGVEAESTDIRGSHLYVTVEPCIMCAAALLYRGVGKVYFGCRNPRFGGNGTVLSVHRDVIAGAGAAANANATAEQPTGYESVGGFREAEAIALLQDFYEQDNPAVPEAARGKRRAARDDDQDPRSC